MYYKLEDRTITRRAIKYLKDDIGIPVFGLDENMEQIYDGRTIQYDFPFVIVCFA